MAEHISVFILGSGEIARCLARLAHTAGYNVSVCDADVDRWQWPDTITLYKQSYTGQPWSLADGTHAVIARGHEGDIESVAALLNNGADRVYLIASARRAQAVLEETANKLTNKQWLNNISTPAGLELGGNGSMEIALSILAEIQMRHHQASGAPLTEFRDAKAVMGSSARPDSECPGKRA